MWNSNAVAGESITLAVNGTVSAYKDGGVTQSTTGVTLTEDFDGLTGVHLVAVDTSADGTFYSAGSDFEVVLSGATIDGKAINATLFSFSLENRSALMPTTAGRKLDVSAGGEAGVDWANVGSPTTVVGLSGTTVKTATDVETDTADIQSRLPAALVSGRIDASVGAMAANTLTAAAIASNAITSAKIATDALTPTHIKSLGRGTVDAGASTTSIPTSACTPAGAVADQFSGRVILFDDDTTTTELRGQATSISASSNAAAPTFTVAALTTAPASGDLFSIV